MDGFESVRVAARALRAEFPASSIAWTSMSTIVAAAKHLDLELAWVPAGDPQLKGACAAYDEQSGTIYCAEDGDVAERSMRVAHEIGHVRVHMQSTVCLGTDVDGSQPMELAPVGLQRVEDYSGRERRELQANVFAREFLLPRDEARRCHIELRMTATEIAERHLLPKDLVRQQLLDALLLPAPTRMASTAVRKRRRDDSQANAAAHRGSPFLLQAGPGTGKTSTLVQRVIGLLKERVDPASIAILTFSNRAAGEVGERVASAAPDVAAQIWIGTFHAFGLDLLRRYHDRLGLPAEPLLFDRSDTIAMLEEILPTLGLAHYRDLWNPARELREMLGAISRAKDELVDSAGYRLLAQGMLDDAESAEARKAAEKAMEVARVYEFYQGELIRNGAVDFGDLVMRPALLLERDASIAASVSQRHAHVLVDEYQDMNRASAHLLRGLTSLGRSVWVVGDSRQSIFRFRGASSVNMGRFSHDYPGATLAQLSLNYRSSTEIVDTLLSLAPRMRASDGMLPLAFHAERGPGAAPPEVRLYDDPELELEGIAASIRELEAQGVALREQAVLCRTHRRLNEVAATLEARGIPVLHLGSIFERDEVRDLLALLSLVTDRRGDGLARVAAMPRYCVAIQDVRAVLHWLRQEPLPVAPRLAIAAAQAEVSADARTALSRLANDLVGHATGSSCWEVLTTYLLDRTRLLADLAACDSARDRMKAIAIWQLVNFLRHGVPVGVGPPIRKALTRVRQMVLLAEDRDLRQVPDAALHVDAVRLMTVHASKGLEFEAAHIPGMTVASFPSSSQGQICPPPHGMLEGAVPGSSLDMKDAHAEEEQCLFFVAVSRARTHLRLYAARTQSNGKKRSPSPFLKWLPPTTIERSFSRTAGAAVVVPQRTEIAWPPDWRVTDAELRAFDGCPRRFFYTHVLDLGTRGAPTAYSLTQGCIHQVARWLAEARVTPTVGEEDALRELERLWAEAGPVGHAFEAEYRGLAERLVRALVRSGADLRFQLPTTMEVELDDETLFVEPDEIAEHADGTLVLRRVRTGYHRSAETEHLDYDLYHLAGSTVPGVRVIVEAVHLTDAERQQIDVPAKRLTNARGWVVESLAAIRAGRFPPAVDAYRCPLCPHFFVCPTIPTGKLSLG